jgi:hypothetical protein
MRSPMRGRSAPVRHDARAVGGHRFVEIEQVVRLVLDFALENEFGAWEKADCHSRLAHHREAARFVSGKTG